MHKKHPELLLAPLPSFMVRIPSLPTQRLLTFFSTQGSQPESFTTVRHALQRSCQALEGELNDSFVGEAILLASPHLFQALPPASRGTEAGETGQTKRSIRAWQKFYSYIARMATRATPFGLYAGVVLGTTGETTHLHHFGRGKGRVVVSPDREWLLSVIQQIEQDEEVALQLAYAPNPSLFPIGERLYLPQGTLTKSEQATLSMRMTPALRRVLALTQAGATIEEVHTTLIGEYPGTGDGEIAAFLQQLRHQGILLSPLLASLNHPEPLTHLLDQLHPVAGQSPLFHDLSLLHELCQRYERAELGTASPLLREIHSQVKQIAPAERDRGVTADLYLETRACVSPAVLQEIAMAAQNLLRISFYPPVAPHLRLYKQRFLERYGHREVPLGELLDETLGLGPIQWNHPPGQWRSADEEDERSRRDTLLTHLVATALRSGLDEIVLEEEILAQLEHPQWQEYLPASAEIYTSLSAQSEEDIERGNYEVVIGPRTGCQPAGRSFGRFGALGDELVPTLSSVHEEERRRSPDYLLAELLCIPLRQQGTNVALGHRHHYMYTISLDLPETSSQTLQISDILVGVREERFYLRSRSLDKEVRVLASHLLNWNLLPQIARFLIEVSRDACLKLAPFEWLGAQDHPFLPRIRVGRAILCLASWKLSPMECKYLRGNDQSPLDYWERLQLFERRIQKWRARWLVPQYVYLCEPKTDQRLILDLCNMLCLSLLLDACNGPSSSLTLQEVRPNLQNAWLNGPDGTYFSEFVIPLVSHPIPTERFRPQREGKTRQLPPLTRNYSLSERLCLPGEEWLYVKLYSHRSQQNSLIAGPIRSLAEEVLQQHLADTWFYLRYEDPDPHLRLRFHGIPSGLLSTLLPLLNSLARSLIEAGLLQKFCIDTYERELERYGGREGLELAEHLFGISSRMCCQILPERRVDSESALSQFDLGVLSTDWFLRAFLARESRLSLYASLSSHSFQETRAYAAFFHAYQKRARELIGNAAWLKQQNGGNTLTDVLHQQIHEITPLAQQFRMVSQAGDFETTPTQYLSSLVHMHCNRLGIDPQDEARLRYCLWQTLLGFQRHCPAEFSLP